MNVINHFLTFFFVFISYFTILTAVLCRSNTLAIYSLKVYTFWNQKDFPKQYPLFRPPAQWSKVFGLTHDPNTVLWREGELARNGIGQMAEEGTTDILEKELNNGTINAFNEFRGSPITTGQGMTSMKFFADGNNSRVSLIMKIVPSPDWFIGLDSYDLCQDGHWINSAVLKVYPMDAGTDDGFTFTSPNWKSEPLHKIKLITNKQPNHPVNSFYYPELGKLPDIGKIIINKANIFTLIDDNNTVPNNLLVTTEDPVLNNKATVNKAYFVKRLKKKYGQHKVSNKRKNLHFKGSIIDCTASDWNKFPVCKFCKQLSIANRRKKVITLTKRRRKILCPIEV